MAAEQLGRTAGSPPHMRGKVEKLRGNYAGARITPAYAGKRGETPYITISQRDHPRICGEKKQNSGSPSGSLGSPPHMRGKVSISADYDTSGEDHPRICGEKSLPRQCTCHPWGSPPHMRGKGSGQVVIGNGHGITPAYAGKRRLHSTGSRANRDHPRICGETRWPVPDPERPQGSPPHMRGKVAPGSFYTVCHRITPAYAGKRAFKARWATSRRDHPRICGEKTDTPFPSEPYIGSPPHMRGKDLPEPLQRGDQGITPAYAGKSLTLKRLTMSTRDHPRICGEKSGRRRTRLRTTGSPPHMRGKD